MAKTRKVNRPRFDFVPFDAEVSEMVQAGELSRREIAAKFGATAQQLNNYIKNKDYHRMKHDGRSGKHGAVISQAYVQHHKEAMKLKRFNEAMR